jgi:hypothetical protein
VWPVGLLVLIKTAAEGIFAQTAKYALHSIFEAFLIIADIASI